MELRLYSFVNFYLSSIQQGIQTGHAAVDLIRHYANPANPHAAMVADWADNHKTFIVLNGGDYDGVREAHAICAASGYPSYYFKESEGALGGLMTCAAVVLPETIFNAYKDPDAGRFATAPYYFWDGLDGKSITYDLSHSAYQLIALLKGSRLAS